MYIYKYVKGMLNLDDDIVDLSALSGTQVRAMSAKLVEEQTRHSYN